MGPGGIAVPRVRVTCGRSSSRPVSRQLRAGARSSGWSQRRGRLRRAGAHRGHDDGGGPGPHAIDAREVAGALPEQISTVPHSSSTASAAWAPLGPARIPSSSASPSVSTRCRSRRSRATRRAARGWFRCLKLCPAAFRARARRHRRRAARDRGFARALRRPVTRPPSHRVIASALAWPGCLSTARRSAAARLAAAAVRNSVTTRSALDESCSIHPS